MPGIQVVELQTLMPYRGGHVCGLYAYKCLATVTVQHYYYGKYPKTILLLGFFPEPVKFSPANIHNMNRDTNLFA